MRVLCFLVFVPAFSICSAFGLRENVGRLSEITRLRRALDTAWADGRLRYATFRTGAVTCRGFHTTTMRSLFGGRRVRRVLRDHSRCPRGRDPARRPALREGPYGKVKDDVEDVDNGWTIVRYPDGQEETPSPSTR